MEKVPEAESDEYFYSRPRLVGGLGLSSGSVGRVPRETARLDASFHAERATRCTPCTHPLSSLPTP